VWSCAISFADCPSPCLDPEGSFGMLQQLLLPGVNLRRALEGVVVATIEPSGFRKAYTITLHPKVQCSVSKRLDALYSGIGCFVDHLKKQKSNAEWPELTNGPFL
jgi:hypothetical protein